MGLPVKHLHYGGRESSVHCNEEKPTKTYNMRLNSHTTQLREEEEEEEGVNMTQVPDRHI